MTLKNKLLTYLGFCPRKESAQDFRVRYNIITLKQKEYRNAIILGIGVAMVSTIYEFSIRGQFSWPNVIFKSVVYPFAYLIGLRLHKRKETKKEETVQRRE